MDLSSLWDCCREGAAARCVEERMAPVVGEGAIGLQGNGDGRVDQADRRVMGDRPDEVDLLPIGRHTLQ